MACLAYDCGADWKLQLATTRYHCPASREIIVPPTASPEKSKIQDLKSIFYQMYITFTSL